ncbi:MAG: DNRLRE domain-containing protein [Syntrophomonas sp.]
MATIVFTPSQDAYISQYYAGQNFGSSPYLYVSRYKAIGDIYRSLIKFDLCSLLCNQIPPNSCIEWACLELPVYRNEIPSGDICLKVFRVLQAWDEGTATWNTQPFAADSPDGTEEVPANFFGTVHVNITDLVRGWYDGYIVNNGILLRGEEDFNSLLGFFSKEFYDSSKWPRLVVKYHVRCCEHKRCCEND